jgi:ABC-type glycerol-3-phosphate transport system permease component
MAAYSFARLEWRGKELMFRIILFGQLVSPISIIIPTFIIVDTLKLTSTYPGLIFLYLSRVAFGVFILRTFFESIPREIEEAGIIDGCSPYQMYFRIMLPLARPSLAAVGVFYFFFVWNDFLYPFVIMHKQKLETIPVAIYNLQGRYGIAWDLQTAALSMAIVPAVIATVLFHRLIVRGLTAGAIK